MNQVLGHQQYLSRIYPMDREYPGNGVLNWTATRHLKMLYANVQYLSSRLMHNHTYAFSYRKCSSLHLHLTNCFTEAVCRLDNFLMLVVILYLIDISCVMLHITNQCYPCLVAEKRSPWLLYAAWFPIHLINSEYFLNKFS